MRLKLTGKLITITPRPVRSVLRRLGFQKVLNLVMSKSEGELIFQTAWVDKFKENKDKVLEYWRKYRYLDEVRKICKFTPETKVLDVGCGISTVLHYVEGEKYGIDPLADEYLGMYEYPAGISIQKGVGEDIPFPDDFFDVVFCSNVLDHTGDPCRVISEVARVLKDGGYFILTVHIFDSNFKRDPAHPHTFAKENVLSLISDDFQISFERESLGAGLDAHVAEDSAESGGKELILILKNRGKI